MAQACLGSRRAREIPMIYLRYILSRLIAAMPVLVAVTLFSFNFIGDGLRDALDPKDR